MEVYELERTEGLWCRTDNGRITLARLKSERELMVQNQRKDYGVGLKCGREITVYNQGKEYVPRSRQCRSRTSGTR